MEPFLLSCIDSKIENNRSFYGRFQLGPFDTGQGITIANALRRTLLSELTGLAVTFVEIQGVSHEYSNIIGVRESVLDILQNIKQLVFKSDFKIHEPQIGYLNISGPTVVRAGDLKLPLPIQCVDPEQYIATLSYNGCLNFKFIINQGKKYLIQTPLDNEYLNQRYLLTNFHYLKTTKINTEGIEPNDQTSYSQNEISFDEKGMRSIPFLHRGDGSPQGDATTLLNENYTNPISRNRQKKKQLESISDLLLTNESNNQNLFKKKSEFIINQYLLSQEWFFKKQKIENIRAKFLQNQPIEPSTIQQTEILQKTNKSLEKKNSLYAKHRVVDVESKEKIYDINNKANNLNKLHEISGFFPIDTIFMPVNKVNYIIELDENYENTKERVILEIWTNGSIHPRHAIHEAIKSLIELFYPFQKTRFTKLFSSYSVNTATKTLNLVKLKIQLNNQLHAKHLITKKNSFLNKKIVNRENLSNLSISNQTNTKKNFASKEIDRTLMRSIIDSLKYNLIDAKLGGDATHQGDVTHLLNSKNSQQLTDSELKQSFISNSPILLTKNEVNSQQKRTSDAEQVENNQFNNFRNIQYEKINSLFKKKLATLDIGNLDLSLKLYIELKNQNINTIYDLLKYSAEDLLNLKTIHKNSLKELKDVLNQVSLYLRNSSSN